MKIKNVKFITSSPSIKEVKSLEKKQNTPLLEDQMLGNLL